jgi:hypothetical protein
MLLITRFAISPVLKKENTPALDNGYLIQRMQLALVRAK